MRRLLLLTLILLPSLAQAADLSCALSTQGSLLRWDNKWQADGEDGDVQYRIQRIVDNKSSVFVELSTAQAAVKPLRFLTVDKKQVLAFCDRVFPKPFTRPMESISMRVGSRPTTRQVNSDENVNKLPFIRYTPKGWVRSDPPDSRQLTVCEIHNRRFACLPEEQTEFASALRSVEIELSNTPK